MEVLHGGEFQCRLSKRFSHRGQRFRSSFPSLTLRRNTAIRPSGSAPATAAATGAGRATATCRRPQQADIRSNTKPVAPANKRPVEQQAKPAPVAPLTEEQIAAKAAVDELLARDPALLAAKQTPDPTLARAAAAKHNAQEAKLAALKAQQEVEAARSKEKNKAREDAKAAAPSAPVHPVLRMPAPEATDGAKPVAIDPLRQRYRLLPENVRCGTSAPAVAFFQAVL